MINDHFHLIIDIDNEGVIEPDSTDVAQEMGDKDLEVSDIIIILIVVKLEDMLS